jgi:hypothetical protein
VNLWFATLAWRGKVEVAKAKASDILGCSYSVNPVGTAPQILSLKNLARWSFIYSLRIWRQMFAQPIPWWRVGESLSILLGFNVTFLVIGCAAVHLRHIKS